MLSALVWVFFAIHLDTVVTLCAKKDKKELIALHFLNAGVFF